MKKYFAIFIALLFIFNKYGLGQSTFQKIIDISNFDRGITVEEVDSIGFVITGFTTKGSSGDQDVLLVLTDLVGDTIWTKTYGGVGTDNGWAVRQIDDEGYIIAGYTDSFGAGGMDVYLLRTDNIGDTLWTKTFGGQGDEFGWDIRKTTDGGFIIAAQTGSFGNGELDAYLIKTDSEGNEEWAKFYGGTKTDRIFSVQQTPDGGYVAAGITYSFTSVGPNDRDAYLLKTDASGESEWFKTFGGDDYDVGHSIALTNDGGYIIVGYGESFSANGSRDVYLIKTDVNGQEQWIKVHGASVEERGIKGHQTSDGGYIAIGFTDRNRDMYLIKTDSVGDMLWTRTFGPSSSVEFGYTVQETSDGGYILTGHTGNFNETLADVLLIKTDQDGLVTDVNESLNNIPQEFYLGQNYPNPFNPTTKIKYAISKRQHAILKVYDVLGSVVATLVDGELPAGEYEVSFNPASSFLKLNSGVYFYQLATTDFIDTRKMILLK